MPKTFAQSTRPAPSIDDVAALNDAVIAAAAAIDDAKGRIVAAKGRREALAARLSQVPIIDPGSTSDLEISMAQALASDPTLSLAGDDLTAATLRRVELRRSVEAATVERDTISTAIATVDREIVALTDEVGRREEFRVRQWQAFLKSAHHYLVERLRGEMTRLVDDTMQAIIDIQSVGTGKAYSLEKVVPFSAWRLDADSVLTLVRTANWEIRTGETAILSSGTGNDEEKLFDAKMLGEVGDSSEAIERFRSTLKA
jgi:hypothetical protein